MLAWGLKRSALVISYWVKSLKKLSEITFLSHPWLYRVVASNILLFTVLQTNIEAEEKPFLGEEKRIMTIIANTHILTYMLVTHRMPETLLSTSHSLNHVLTKHRD